jgi:ATP-dependent helicase/nuclease subunit A
LFAAFRQAMNLLTRDQQRAIESPGNVLVMAGAGTGKTRTLVERCLARVLAPTDPVSLDAVLMVTFTEAAAGEMRKRIRERLEEQSRSAPADPWLTEQIALLDTARICTLHSFCRQLVREHFHDLGLDPEVAVLEQAQAEVLAAETVDQLLQARYAGDTPRDEAVQQLILTRGGGRDEAVRRLVRRVHEYTQTLPDPEGWFRSQLAQLDLPQPLAWREWLATRLAGWRADWLETLSEIQAENPNAQHCRAALETLVSPAGPGHLAEVLARILAADGNWPTKRKGALRPPLAKLFAEADFLLSLVEATPAAGAPSQDPLQEDWDWVRPHLRALLDLARDFTAGFGRTKRELGAVDFHDLEQFALELLWDRAAHRPTRIAEEWREKLALVLVDEYQDINAAQDRIIQAVSREGELANRFLVGDVKQSIYRFRLANPRIFQDYANQWRRSGAGGRVIPLSDNFRSHEAILNCVNALFAGWLRPEVGGVGYEAEARLRFGDPNRRQHHAAKPAAPAAPSQAGQPHRHGPPIELRLRLTGGAAAPEASEAPADSGPAGSFADHSDTEKEAALIGSRLRELKEQGLPVWDHARQAHRPVTWGDMVILLRSPRNKAEGFAKVFNRLGLPLVASRRGLYDTSEVSDLLSLLMLLDNPLQDIPALALLRSPLGGFTLNELALVRLAQRQGNIWTALKRFLAAGRREGDQPELAAWRASAWAKARSFLEQYARWRELARRGAVSRCLEDVLEETRYQDWLLTQERGAQRRANVEKLLDMTRQFDQFQRQGLFRFLKFVEAQQATEFEPEPAAVEAEDAVRLMSVHQSKGLEFPVVVVADLGKRFNLEDLRADVMLDEEYGPCLCVKPPQTGPSYPSLPYWLASRRQRRELLGEELRLLYVAMTRACDRLILTGTASRKTAEKWAAGASARLSTGQLVAATCYLDWLGPVVGPLNQTPDWLARPAGQGALLAWRLVEDDELGALARPSQIVPLAVGQPDPVVAAALRARLAWQYPHQAATVQSAKTSVSALRRRVAEESDEEASAWVWIRRRGRAADRGSHAEPQEAACARTLSAAEIGAAHHRFLQFVAFERVGSEAELAAEAARLARDQLLTAAEQAALDFSALAAFWRSALGRKIREQVESVHRELPFTARFSQEDLRSAPLPGMAALPPDEFIVVQGVVDLAVIRPEAIWVVDFKTDRLRPSELADHARAYAPQLALYALALSRIYSRPTTETWLHFLALGQTVRV